MSKTDPIGMKYEVVTEVLEDTKWCIKCGLVRLFDEFPKVKGEKGFTCFYCEPVEN